VISTGANSHRAAQALSLLALILSIFGLATAGDFAWPVRVAVLVAGLASYSVALRMRNPIAALSPLLLLGAVAAGPFSLLPALYITLGRIPSETFQNSRLDLFLGSPAELLILEFASACFLMNTLITPKLPIPGNRADSDSFRRTWLVLAPIALASTAVSIVLRHGAVDSDTWTLKTLGDSAAPLLCLLAAITVVRGTLIRKPSGAALDFATFAAAIALLYEVANLKVAAFLGVASLIVALSATKLTPRRIVAGVAIAIALVAAVGWLNIIKTGQPASLYTSIASKFVLRQSDTGFCLRNALVENPPGDPSNVMWLFAGLVPRPLWSPKPNLSVGMDDAVRFCHYTSDIVASSRHSASITLLGEPFVVAGWQGLVVAEGMLLICLAGSTILAARFGLAGIASLIALVPWLIDFDQHFPLFLAQLAKNGLLCLPFMALLARWSRPPLLEQ
jgi:hypothetical protein